MNRTCGGFSRSQHSHSRCNNDLNTAQPSPTTHVRHPRASVTRSHPRTPEYASGPGVRSGYPPAILRDGTRRYATLRDVTAVTAVTAVTSPKIFVACGGLLLNRWTRQHEHIRTKRSRFFAIVRDFLRLIAILLRFYATVRDILRRFRVATCQMYATPVAEASPATTDHD